MTTAVRRREAARSTASEKAKAPAPAAAPTAAEVLAELETLGSAQTVKTYRRHGVIGPCWGVSYAELYKLAKRLKTNHSLALALWESGNHDARVLGTMIADPSALPEDQLEGWLRSQQTHVLTGAIGDLAIRHPDARARAELWIESDHEHVACAGWQVLAKIALDDASLEDEYFAAYVRRIEATIATARNRERYELNNMLIAIGGRSPGLRELAEDAARRIGKVQVDHGDTSCKTPDAVPYIAKMWARKEAKAASAPTGFFARRQSVPAAP